MLVAAHPGSVRERWLGSSIVLRAAVERWSGREGVRGFPTRRVEDVAFMPPRGARGLQHDGWRQGKKDTPISQPKP